MPTRINGVTNRDIHNLACAATGVAINRADSTEELQQYLLFGGAAMALPTALKVGKGVVWDLPKWGYQNYGNYKNAFGNVWNNTIGQTNLYSANRAALKGNFWNTVNHNATMVQLNQMNIPQFDTRTLQTEAKHLAEKANGLKANQTDDALTALNKTLKRTANNATRVSTHNALLKADIYKDVNRLVQEAKGLTGPALKAKLLQIEKAKANAEIAWNNAKAGNKYVHKTKVGKAASWVKTKTGVRSAQNAITNATKSSNMVTKTVAKGVKGGGGAMAVIGLACEAPTIVKTYKELGAGKGTKQLAKSTAVVAAETVGYVAGAKIGGITGAKAGAAIGTCIGGPIGTAIGGAVGAIIGVGCGLLGSWLCGKAARAVVGKDELTLAKEKQCEELEKMAKNDIQAQIELAIAARENLENGTVQSESDAEDIAKSYTKVETGLSQTQIPTFAETSIAQNATNFGTTIQPTYNEYSYPINQNLYDFTNNNFAFNQFNPYSFANPFMSFNPFGNINNMYGFNPYNTMQFNNPYMMNNLGLVA